MKLQTFVFAHDQDIIINQIAKFSKLDNLSFVLLGQGEADKLEGFSNVLIARNYEDNIECYPKLTSFTGWYVLWKHKLYQADYISLFEYDICLAEDFSSKLNEALDHSKIIGFVPFSVHDWVLFKNPIWIEALQRSLSKNYGIDLQAYVKSLESDRICSMTCNHTFETKTFERYMEWVYPMLDDIKVNEKAGHNIERSISVFYLLNKIDVKIIPYIMDHVQLGSHGT